MLMWTEKDPYTAGFYWMRLKPVVNGPRSRIVHDPEVVEMFYVPKTSEKRIRHVGVSTEYPLPDNAEWIGPLEPLT